MSIVPTSQLLLTAPQLGQLLVSTRKRHKLTQAAVASRVGLSQNRISHLEQHPDEISIRQLLSWCSVLELDLRLGARDTSAASNSAEW
jgi:HTH-type transcriptional regulator/antitoxin HipB